MITKESLKTLLDEISGASHSKRTWIGQISKSHQIKYFGRYFGAAVLRICEIELTVCELRRSKNGYIKHSGQIYEIRSKFKIAKPLLSTYDRASPTARSSIIALMIMHKSSTSSEKKIYQD